MGFQRSGHTIDQRGRQEGSGRVVDHHRVRRAAIAVQCSQSGTNRGGPCRAAVHGPEPGSNLAGYPVEMRRIGRICDHDEIRDPGVLQQGRHGSREHGFSAQHPELLGNAAAGAFPASGRDNDSADPHPIPSSIAAAQHCR